MRRKRESEKYEENSEKTEKTRARKSLEKIIGASFSFQNTQSHTTTVLSAAKHSDWKLAKGYRDKK